MLSSDVKSANPRYLILTPILVAAALFIYKAGTSLRVLRSTWSSQTIAGRPEVVALGQPISINALERSVNYLMVIWPALVFGILIAAAVRAFVPPQWFARVTKSRSVKTQLAAGLAGTPLMLCSCCVAPVFMSVAENSTGLAPAVSLMLASPMLNPAALTLTFILFESKIALSRLALSLLAVVLIGPAIERIFRGFRVKDSPDLEFAANSSQSSLLKFLRSVAAVSIQTVPGLIAGVVASMLIVQWLPLDAFASPGGRVAAVLIAATAAVPLALPTFLEIPLALSLLAAGFPAGAAVALLIAGPAINLPSLLTVARMSGWKVAAGIAMMIWILAIGGGLLIR